MSLLHLYDSSLQQFHLSAELLIWLQNFQPSSLLLHEDAIVIVFSSAQLCPTLCDIMDHSTPGLPVHHQLLKFTPNSCPLSQWCHLTISSSVTPFSSCPQSFPATVFSNESALRIKWPKYWSFSFSISPSNEYLGLKLITLSLLTSTLSLLLIYYLSSACSVSRIEQISYITSNLQTILWSVYYDPCFM